MRRKRFVSGKSFGTFAISMILVLLMLSCAFIVGATNVSANSNNANVLSSTNDSTVANGANVSGSMAKDRVSSMGSSLSVLSHPLSGQEARNLQSIIGTMDPQKSYDVIVDGYGTGLAPPTSQEWNASVGTVRVVDSVEPTLLCLHPGTYPPPSTSLAWKIRVAGFLCGVGRHVL